MESSSTSSSSCSGDEGIPDSNDGGATCKKKEREMNERQKLMLFLHEYEVVPREPHIVDRDAGIVEGNFFSMDYTPSSCSSNGGCNKRRKVSTAAANLAKDLNTRSSGEDNDDEEQLLPVDTNEDVAIKTVRSCHVLVESFLKGSRSRSRSR
jgi:hypothetical protein